MLDWLFDGFALTEEQEQVALVNAYLQDLTC